MVRTGSKRSNTGRSQPTKIAILPVAARWQPPETGQSTGLAPFASTREPIRVTSAASVVLISAQILPFVRPARIPSSASITEALTSGDGRQVMMISHVCAISFGLSAHFAPESRKEAAASRWRSRTTTSHPLRIRLPASLPPTFPSPINPILSNFTSPVAVFQRP